jgi:hypothetical protein
VVGGGGTAILAVGWFHGRDARVTDHKKGACRQAGRHPSVDGYINFFDDKSGQAKQVIVQVKSGYVGVNHVRDLKGVIQREKAAIGALITLRQPTKPLAFLTKELISTPELTL